MTPAEGVLKTYPSSRASRACAQPSQWHLHLEHGSLGRGLSCRSALLPLPSHQTCALCPLALSFLGPMWSANPHLGKKRHRAAALPRVTGSHRHRHSALCPGPTCSGISKLSPWVQTHLRILLNTLHPSASVLLISFLIQRMFSSCSAFSTNLIPQGSQPFHPLCF